MTSIDFAGRGKLIAERLNALDSGLSPDSVRSPESSAFGLTASPIGSPDLPLETADLQEQDRTADSYRGCSPESELADRPLYADVAAMLAGTLPEPPTPEVLRRGDGRSLFYRGQVNLLFGDPESGKTWVALAACVECINAGMRVLVLDLDHNGAAATIGRLLMMGASKDKLGDLDYFRYCEPEHGGAVAQVVKDCHTWRPVAAVVDSIGELLPMLGADSNSADDFTRAHTRVLKPLAHAGAAVIAIDHLAKNTDSRARGPGGTAAKRRAVGGVSLRVKAQRQFTPGKGGTALLLVNKDRHGGLREHCPVDEREPIAGTFVLREPDNADPAPWSVLAPMPGQRDPESTADPADLAVISAMDPPPTSAEQVRKQLRCSKDRANLAWGEWKEKHS